MSATNSDHLQTESGRELQKVIDDLLKGVRDPDAMRKAREEMDRSREELRQRIGTVDVVVGLVREMRD